MPTSRRDTCISPVRRRDERGRAIQYEPEEVRGGVWVKLSRLNCISSKYIFDSFIDPFNMRIWIEVARGNEAWENKIFYDSKSSKRGLTAPRATKYFRLFKEIAPGDILLTHLTHHETLNKQWKGSIVGISRISSETHTVRTRLTIDTDTDVELPVPIKYAEYRNIANGTDLLKKAIRMRMQQYIFEIGSSDLLSLLSLHKENIEHLNKIRYFGEEMLR